MAGFEPRSRRGSRALVALAAWVLMSAATVQAAAPVATAVAPGSGTQAFALSEVRLQSGPLFDAQQRDLQYLLALDPARLLAPFRREAGLPALKPSYDNWESTGLDGHMGGHYLSALSLMAAATGDPRVQARLAEFVQGLQACQAAQREGLMAGYLGGIPDGKVLWQALARGELAADNFSLNGRWVPWYNVHKTLAGLRDAWLHGRQPAARDMLLRMVDWVARVTAGLSDAQMQAMLRTEHGGMVEVLADAHAISGNPAHLALARRFVDQAVVQPLAAQQDRLDGLHANTQIPKLMGVQRLAELAGPAEAAGAAGAAKGADLRAPAAQFFWQQLVQKRSVPMGGNSVKEHFHDRSDFQSMLQEVEGPESCNTYNLLKLTGQLFHQHPDRLYTDYAERALFNHVLSAQHPRTGGLVYFTPQRPNHYRVYSTVDEGMWCCVGSGLEVHGRHAELIYAQDAETLWVNLYAASTLDAPAQGLRLQQETGFPDSARTTLRWLAPSPRALKVRVPAWVQPGRWSVRVNGRRVQPVLGVDGYIRFAGPWAAGDRVELSLPMHSWLEGLPDGSALVAVLHGPIVLAMATPAAVSLRAEAAAQASGSAPPTRHFGDASRMGHIASGPVCAPEATWLIRDPQAFLADLRPVPGQPLHFSSRKLSAATATPGEVVELMPFFRLHETRYQMLWPRVSSASLRQQQLRQAAQARELAALRALTVDEVAPGEQQPESDHGYQAEGGEAGLNLGRRWRHATGWFSYVLKDPQGQAKSLRLTLARADAGRQFEVQVNGQTLPLRLNGDAATGAFYDLDLPLPADVLARSPGTLTVRLVAHPGSVAGGLYGLRLLKK